MYAILGEHKVGRKQIFIDPFGYIFQLEKHNYCNTLLRQKVDSKILIQNK